MDDTSIKPEETGRRSGKRRSIDDGSVWRRALIFARLNKLNIFLAAIVVLPVLVASGYLLIKHFTAPHQLTIGVLPGSPEAKVLETLQTILMKQNAKIRLDLRAIEQPGEINNSFQKGLVDVAVLRTDRQFPGNAQSIAIFRETTMTLITLKQKEADDFRDVAHQSIGVLSPEVRDLDLIRRVTGYFTKDAKDPVPFNSIEAAAQALKTKKVEALAWIFSEGQFGRPVISQLSKVTGPEIQFVPVSDFASVAALNPGFFEGTIAAKSLSTKPPLPAEELKTLKVQHRLAARDTLDRSYVAALTEALFKNRIEIARSAPGINSIKTIDDDYVTSSLFPVHTGALDYFRREQMNFYERYNDAIWLLILYGGSLLSGIVWLGQSALTSRRKKQQFLLEELVEIVDTVNDATELEDIREAERGLNALVCEAIVLASRGQLSHRRLTALTLGETVARKSIEDRRAELTAAAQ